MYIRYGRRQAGEVYPCNPKRFTRRTHTHIYIYVPIPTRQWSVGKLNVENIIWRVCVCIYYIRNDRAIARRPTENPPAKLLRVRAACSMYASGLLISVYLSSNNFETRAWNVYVVHTHTNGLGRNEKYSTKSRVESTKSLCAYRANIRL